MHVFNQCFPFPPGTWQWQYVARAVLVPTQWWSHSSGLVINHMTFLWQWIGSLALPLPTVFWKLFKIRTHVGQWTVIQIVKLSICPNNFFQATSTQRSTLWSMWWQTGCLLIFFFLPCDEKVLVFSVSHCCFFFWYVYLFAMRSMWWQECSSFVCFVFSFYLISLSLCFVVAPISLPGTSSLPSSPSSRDFFAHAVQ